MGENMLLGPGKKNRSTFACILLGILLLHIEKFYVGHSQLTTIVIANWERNPVQRLRKVVSTVACCFPDIFENNRAIFVARKILGHLAEPTLLAALLGCLSEMSD